MKKVALIKSLDKMINYAPWCYIKNEADFAQSNIFNNVKKRGKRRKKERKKRYKLREDESMNSRPVR